MRIVALSDQHGFLPDIPLCDLLIVAGDVCPDRFGPFMAVHDRHQQQAWFDREVRPWLAAAPATHRLLTWGNHDWCGQSCSFREDSPAYARSTDLQILVDEATTIPCSDGTKRHVSVWATPWSNRFMRWAFMKKPSELEAVYAAIPEGIHILVSHQPPLYYGDRTFNLDAGRVEHVGSRELLDAVERVRPRIVVCGHVHGGFLSPLMRAGVTATPWRGDDYDIEQMFGPALVRMGIAEGLQGGFLCDLDYRLLADNIDWELVQDLSIHRYSLGQLNRRLILPTRDEEAVRIIADVFQTTRRRGGIIFSPSIAHAREFAAMLRAYGFRAEEISSQDDARLREMKLSRFRGRCKRRCALKRDREPRML